MKILAFVDLHGSEKALKEIEKKAKKADVLVCAGDVTLFENNIKSLFNRLNKIGKTILMIPGNHESETVLKELCKIYENIIYVNKQVVEIDHVQFFCYEGNGFALNDKEFETGVKQLEPKLDYKKTRVFVFHASPYATKLDIIDKHHVGNNSITNFIKKHNPHLVIVGHLHENARVMQKIKQTLIVNPGPSGMIFEI